MGGLEGLLGDTESIKELEEVHVDWYKDWISGLVGSVEDIGGQEYWGGSVDASKWKAAQKADNKFISKYAKEFPDGEDVAETILWWVAVKCKPDRISKSNYKKVLKAIPNRLKYLDEQNYDVYPLVCK